MTVWNTREGYSFYEFEHRYLGNVAFELAEAELYRISQQTDQDPFLNDWKYITRDVFAFEDSARYRSMANNPANDGPLKSQAIDFLSLIPLGFGDLAALAGDHAETPRHLQVLFKKIRSTESDSTFLSSGELKSALAIRRQWLNACRWYYQSEHDLKFLHRQRTQDVCFGGKKDAAQFLDLEKTYPVGV
jgi:hypothetical protein